MAGNRKSYLRHAEEAEANAARATDASVKRRFLEIAAQWRLLARPPGRWSKPPDDDGSAT
jgi:hypothetical protein